jgi:PBSX family phage terminase large subunit
MAVAAKKVADFNFKPFSKKQNKTLKWWEHEQIAKNDIIILDGAIRSGKTISGICSFLKWSQSNFIYNNFIVAGKSIGSLKRNVINPMRQISASWGWSDNYNRSENYLNIGSNTYYLFGANNESSQDTLQGLTAAGAFADEIALFPMSFIEQMIGRCSVEGAKIFCNCNPQGPYHPFKLEYINKAIEKMIYYLHFTMDDNLTLSEDVKARYKRMFSGVFFKRYILGLWVMAEGIIYDMFDENKHVMDTSIIKDFEMFYISVDYGTNNPFSAGLWGKKLGIWHRIKEFYYSGKESGKQKDNEAYYNNLVELAGNRPVREIIIDPSALSMKTTIKKYGKFRVKDANNSVLEGIENTSTALNKEMIKIDNNCKNTIKEFYSYMWDEKAVLRGEDKPIKQHDHAMDDIRYFTNTILFNKREIRLL